MRVLKVLISAGLALAVVACGGGGGGGAPAPAPTYTVSGSITGLLTGEYVVLLDNGANATTFTSNGTHSYTGAIATGTAYNITVQTQPVGETCTVSNGTGTVTANVTNVAVTCLPNNHTIGGSITGVANGEGVILVDNGGDQTTVTGNGSASLPFTFSTPLASGSTYSVTVFTPPQGKACSVTHGSGTVAGANITNVAVACSTVTYPVNVSVSGLPLGKSIVLQDNGVDDLTISGNGVTPFQTTLSMGTNYAVSIMTQPLPFNCSVNGSASGQISNSAVTVTVDCPHHAYVTDITDGELYIYSVNNMTGALSQLNPGISPFTTATGPYDIAASPVANYLYVGSAGNSGIQGFAIDTSTGGLTALIGNPFTTGVQPQGIAIDPLGQFAYSADFASDSVSAFTASSLDGSLSSVNAYSLTANSGPFTPAITPDSKYVYVADSKFGTGLAGGNISAFAINSSTGALTALAGSPFAVGETCPYIAIDPSGKYLFAVGNDNARLYTYSIATGGSLSQIGFKSVQANPSGIAIHPTGKFVYVANFGANPGTISAFSLSASTGALTAISGSPFTTGLSPESVYIDPTGQFLYVMNSTGSNISGYAINPTTGALTELSGSPFAAGSKPQLMIIR